MPRQKPDTDPSEADPLQRSLFSEAGKVSAQQDAADGRTSPDEQGDDTDARMREPYGPGQYRSGTDLPGPPAKKNPGHAHPAHNTPGHHRGDAPEPVPRSAQVQPPSYPGIRGPEARRLAGEGQAGAERSPEKRPRSARSDRRDRNRGRD